MNLTKHFTLEELTISTMARKAKLDNTLPDSLLPNMKRSAELLEQVRTLLNKPIFVHSGYRSPAVNKAVGGKTNPPSQHTQALAVDFVCPQFGTPEDICRTIEKSNLIFGKVILEYNSWVHIQVGTERKVLTINEHGTFNGIHP